MQINLAGWWIIGYIAISVGLSLLSSYLAGKKASQLAEDDVAEGIRWSKVKYGTPLPVVFGTIKLGAFYIDAGDCVHDTIEEGDTMWTLRWSNLRRYKAILGVSICLGPIDYLISVGVGTFNAEFNESISGDSVDITGGPIENGTLYWGTTTQTSDSQLASLHMTNPSYRNVCYASLYVDIEGVTSLPAWYFIVSKWVDPIGAIPAYMTGTGVNKHANLIQVLYWILTNEDFMLGISTGNIVLADFVSASTTLEAENLGGSLLMERGSEDIGETVDTICQWIGASLIEIGGLFSISLHRSKSYETIVNDEDIVAGSFEMKRKSWNSVTPRVLVEFLNSGRDFDQDAVLAVDEGAIYYSPSFRVAKYNFKVAATMTQATLVAQRLLLNNSYPFAKITITVNRTDIYQEMVIRVIYTKLGFACDCRVMNVFDIGGGKSRLELVEEIQESGYDLEFDEGGSEEQIAEWVTAAVTWEVFESYFRGILALSKRPEDEGTPIENFVAINVGLTVGNVNMTSGYPLAHYPSCLGVLRSELPISYYPVDRENTLEITLSEDALPTLSTLTDAEWFSGGIVVKIDDEIIYAKTVTVQSWGYQLDNLLRGMELTSNASHSEDADVHLILQQWPVVQINSTYNQSSLTVGKDVTVAMTPLYLLGNNLTSDTDNEDSDTLEFKGLIERPLPVCNIQIEDQGSDITWTGTPDLTFNWRSRTRYGGAGMDGAGNYASNQNKSEHESFTIEVEQPQGVFVIRYTGITDNYWEYTNAQRVTDGLTPATDFWIKVYAVDWRYAGDGVEFKADYIA